MKVKVISGARMHGFESQLYHSLAVWPSASNSTSPIPMGKVGTVAAPFTGLLQEPNVLGRDERLGPWWVALLSFNSGRMLRSNWVGVPAPLRFAKVMQRIRSLGYRTSAPEYPAEERRGWKAGRNRG